MKKIFTISLLLFTGLLNAQDSLLNYFTVAETGTQTILLSWEIKNGNTCNGIEIQRGTNDSTFQLIHFISGICGNSSVPVAYQFEDTEPVPNQTNYYRLKLGLGEPTRPVSIFFVKLNTDGYFIFPNPTENQIKIYFRNPGQNETICTLSNLSGQVLLNEQVNADFWEPDLSKLASGTYIFSIDNNSAVVSGKIVKN